MGTDIHQLNIQLGRYGEAIRAEGDAIIFEKYSDGFPDVEDFSLLEELIPYRWYDIFNVVAGVRGDMFEATKLSSKGTPPCMIDCKLDYEYHSLTWFYIEDFVDSMKFAGKRIGLFADSYKVEEDESEASEYESLSAACYELAEKSEKAMKKHRLGGKSFIVLFYFDS